jgi:ParB family chromosome partitioning protein
MGKTSQRSDAVGFKSAGQKAHADHHPPQVKYIRIAQIKVRDPQRECNPIQLQEMCESIREIGIQSPIHVRPRKRKGLAARTYILVAGLHRLQAAKALGYPTIACIIINGGKIKARRWQIAENLHRAELTVLERAEHIQEWIELTQHDEISGQDGQKRKRGRPLGEISKTARELGISGETQEARRKVVLRARKIAGISQEAKAAAREAGLADNQAALLEIAKEAEPQAQLDKVSEIARPKQSANRKHASARKKSGAKRSGSEEPAPEADDLDLPPFLDRRTRSEQIAASEELSRLKVAWDHADALREAWKRASESARERFIEEVLRGRQSQTPEPVHQGDG